MKKERRNVTIENKKAYHDYFIEETLECGIVLKGNEVKSIRCGMANIKSTYILVDKSNQLIVRGMNITKWDTSNLFDVDEKRDRILLAHKKEIKNLMQKSQADGYSLLPLKIYFVNGKCKMLIGLGKGKKAYDKRNVLKDKEIKRNIQRKIKTYT